MVANQDIPMIVAKKKRYSNDRVATQKNVKEATAIMEMITFRT